MSNVLWTLNQLHFGSVVRPRLSVEDLRICSGVTAVLGESGAGKTSLLNLLVQFETNYRGTINFPTTRAATLSWVPPDFGLWSPLKVREHLAAVSVGNTVDIDGLLSSFDLQHVSEQRPETLSMGERSRLAVARGLATQAAVIVMDEPFAHVDAGRVDGYWKVVRESLNATQSSLVFSSHSPRVVLREADEVICLNAGKLAWSGSPHELYHTPPNPQLARLLGPVNWFTSHEADLWWHDESNVPESLRPERLIVESAESSSLVVEQTWSVGSHVETEIRDTKSGQMRTFYHSASGRPLERGMQVALRFVLLLIFSCSILFSQGCRETSGDEPELPVDTPQHSLLPAEGAMLPAARAMTFGPAEELYVLDNVGRVLEYDSQGNFQRKWWMPEYDIGRPEGLCVLKDGRLAVADTHYNRVVFFDQNAEVVGMFGSSGYEPGQFIYTSAVVQDDEGFLYVAEYGGNDRIQKFTDQGEFVLQFGHVGTEQGEFQRPSGLVWHNETLYVADAINNRVQAFSRDGTFLRVVADAQSAGLYYPYDISLGPEETLFLIEYGAGRMTCINLAGELVGRYGMEGRGVEHFWTPWGIAVSPSGQIAVADTGNRRVVKLHLD